MDEGLERDEVEEQHAEGEAVAGVRRDDQVVVREEELRRLGEHATQVWLVDDVELLLLPLALLVEGVEHDKILLGVRVDLLPVVVLVLRNAAADAEVAEERQAVFVDEDVVQLYIAVDEPVLVELHDGVGDDQSSQFLFIDAVLKLL